MLLAVVLTDFVGFGKVRSATRGPQNNEE